MFDNILGVNSRLTTSYIPWFVYVIFSPCFHLVSFHYCTTCVVILCIIYEVLFSPLTGSRIAESVHGCRTGCGLCCSPGGGLQRVKMRQTAGKDAQYAGENGTIGHFRRFHHIWSSGLYAGCPDSVHLSIWDICYDYSQCVRTIFHVCFYVLDVRYGSRRRDGIINCAGQKVLLLLQDSL